MFVFPFSFLFFFNDTATTEIYTLSLHDALPIFRREAISGNRRSPPRIPRSLNQPQTSCTRYCRNRIRSEEHTSELQSHSDLVCRLLLEKKKKIRIIADDMYKQCSTIQL